MGYPMSYRRFINRNRLAEGDYANLPFSPYPHVKIDEPLCGFESVEALERAYRSQFNHWNDDRAAQHSRESCLRGDLRRLERDTIDEDAICRVVADKAGADPEIAAAVLKEWIAT